MAIEKVTQTDYLLNTIDEMIRELQLRRDEILATRPVKEIPVLASSFVGPTGKTFYIKGRKHS